MVAPNHLLKGIPSLFSGFLSPFLASMGLNAHGAQTDIQAKHLYYT